MNERDMLEHAIRAAFECGRRAQRDVADAVEATARQIQDNARRLADAHTEAIELEKALRDLVAAVAAKPANAAKRADALGKAQAALQKREVPF